jgi:hypothetical protein
MPRQTPTFSNTTSLGPAPVYRHIGRAHWQKWPSIMACGLKPPRILTAEEIEASPPAWRDEWCEHCLVEAGAWFGATYQIVVENGLNIKDCGLEQTRFESLDHALAEMRLIRLRALGMTKRLGQYPHFRITLDLSAVDQDRLARHAPITGGESI